MGAGPRRPGPAWRARTVAEATIHSSPVLTREAAAWVDSQVAAVAGRIGPAQLDRLVAEAIKRYELADDVLDPAADPEDGHLYVDPRHVTVDTDDVHFAGTMHVEAEIDIADALDLDRALAHHAATQKALGSQLSLNARRAKALGDLARTQTALDLFSQGKTGAKDTDGLPIAREVVLHAHFAASTEGEVTVFGPTGRLEEGQRLILLDQLKAGAATRGPRSPSSPSSTSPSRCRRPAMRSPTGSASTSSSATAPASSRGAPARPGVATSTTSTPTTIRPTPKADRNRARRTPTTSPRCAGSTTASRPTPPGATRWSNPVRSCGPAPTATGSDATHQARQHSAHPSRVHHGSRSPADHNPAPTPRHPPVAGSRRVPGC